MCIAKIECYVHVCLNSKKDLVRFGKKWKMINNPGHPLTLKNDQNIQKISEIVRKVRRLSVRMIADMYSINRETLQQTFRKKRPNLWKFGRCIRTMPQLTTPFCSSSFFTINAFEYNILHIHGFSIL